MWMGAADGNELAGNELGSEMTGIPIISELPGISRNWPRIDAALRRIAIGTPPGRWREPPSRIRVVQELTDGRSGALVLRLKVERGTQHVFRIAKIGPLAEARAEWRAFTDVFEQAASVLCPPLEAVTEGVLDSRHAPAGEDEAVVYADVEQYAGAGTTSLEDLVAAAAADSPGVLDAAVNAIGRLLMRAADVLYSRCATEPGPELRLAVSQSLGPAVHILADRIDLAGQPPRGAPLGRPPGLALPGTVLTAALDLPGADESAADEDGLRAGAAIALSELTLRQDGDRLLGEREYVTVQVIGPGGAADGFAALAGAGPATVYGRLSATRSALTWERIVQAMPGIQIVTPGVVEVAGTRTAHPFAALRSLLMEPVAGMITATVHGDLNARNVLIADDRPFLIDYARARRGQPILGDLAWLEINLLRHPLSASLSFAELVELQRLLAIGDRLADLLPDAQHAVVTGTLLRLVSGRRPRLIAPLRVLREIRRHARLIYVGAQQRTWVSAQPWWREYASQLALAAHRTFKWPDDMQTGATWRSAVAAAAVATELLRYPDDPWHLWDPGSLAAAAQAILPLLPDTDRALPVLAGLVRGVDSSGASPAVDEEIERTRARLVTAAFAVPARRAADLRGDHDLYIDLPGQVLPDACGRAAFAAGEPAGPARPPGPAACALVADAAQIIVLGASGTGKTALLGELEYRLTTPESSAVAAGAGPQTGRARTALARLPVRVPAGEVASALAQADGPPAATLAPVADRMPTAAAGRVPLPALLAAGAVHLLIDDFDKVPAAGRAAVAGWLRAIRCRFPRTPVVLCHRETELPAELPGWAAVLLGEPSDAQIVGYLARCHTACGLTAARMAALVAAVRDGPDPGIRELARTPLLLWMLASTSMQAHPARTAGDLADAYVRGLESRSADDSRWLRCAEALAGWQADAAETATADKAFLTANPHVATHWDDAREQLTQLGILAADDTVTRFRLQIYRDYFAARLLQAAGQPEREALVLRFGWRDAFALFASFTSTRPAVLHGLISAVADADPCFAARLLRAADRPPADLVDWFGDRQERILRDSQAGQAAQARAAQALAEMAACRRLLTVLTDPAAGPAASGLSLAALLRAYHAGGSGGRRRWLGTELACRLGQLLGPDSGSAVRVAALRAISDLELRGLELIMADLLEQPGPWPVIHAAQAALRQLGVLLPARLQAACLRAQQARLAEVEDELPRTTSPAEASQLQAERYVLAGRGHGPGRLARLLERRFAFEIAGPVADLLDGAPAAAEPGPPSSWQAIISGRACLPSDLLASAAGPDRLAAAAAAHRLLRDHPELAGQLFLSLTAGHRTDQPLLAAAAAAQLGAAQLPAITGYFRRLLHACGTDAGVSLEGLAAVAEAIYALDPQAGTRLVWEAHGFLSARQRPDRLRWPWSTALARFGGTPAQLDALLGAGRAADCRLAVDVLGRAGFLRTGGRPPVHEFSEAARQRLLHECHGADAGQTIRLLRAAAAMSLPEALSALFSRAAGRPLADAIASLAGQPAQVLSVPGHGLVEVAPMADALAALGYLGRLEPGRSGTAAKVHRLLSNFHDARAHPSVRAGRLIGLGFLGDWPVVLDALGPTEPRMDQVARNAVELWTPGPQTQAGLAGPACIARWIADRLRGTGLTPGSRSLLMGMKRYAEERAGALTPGPDPASDKV
jgi:hypothetical protein